MDELVNAWVGDRDTPFQMGLLAVFEPGPFAGSSVGPDGEVDTARVVRELSARALGVPELGRRVVWTRLGEGRPVWVDVPDQEVTRQVGATRVAAGTDLPAWAANRAMRPLDRERPLWRAEVVDGLPDGRFAVLVVVHHVLADGLAGMRLLASLLDREADAVRGEPPVRTPSSPPSHRDLVHHRQDSTPEDRDEGHGHRGRFSGVARRALAEYREARSAFAGPLPRTSLPRTVGPTRRMAVVSADLDALRDGGHRRGATVNDLLLAAVTQGLRDLLAARGEWRESLFVRAILPVATDPLGQAASMMVVDLPVGVPDPDRRLATIVEATAAGKARLRATGGSGVNLLALPVPIARIVLPWARRRGSRKIGLSVTNVPGPPEPLWLAGAHLVQAVPIPPLVPLVGLTVAALSYDGRLTVAVNADGAVVDLAILGDGIATSLGAVDSARRAPRRDGAG